MSLRNRLSLKIVRAETGRGARADAELDPSASGAAALRARVGRLCHLIRAVSVAWAAWVLVAILWMWRDLANVTDTLGHYLNTDLSGTTTEQYAWAFSVHVGAWLPDVAVAYCLWRLFGTYLAGRIFTADAAQWMQRVGIAGVAAVLVGLAGRRLDWLILTSGAHLSLETRLITQLVTPTDLLKLLFCLFVIAVAPVFKAAAEMADDYSRIV